MLKIGGPPDHFGVLQCLLPIEFYPGFNSRIDTNPLCIMVFISNF